MPTTIDTLKLGPVKISLHVIEYFKRVSDDGDTDRATDELVVILSSNEIEKLEVPAMIAQRMPLKSANSNQLEFWVHPASSMTFIISPQDDYQLVTMALKQSMDGFVFDDC
ncbi:MAG: hypothetical protein GYB18_14430 [Oceanospirillales bacterium]|nr:hypothetical protein [Oceanospirillales bacterium]